MSILSNTNRIAKRNELMRPEGLPDGSSGNLFTYGLALETAPGRFYLHLICGVVLPNNQGRTT